MQHLKTLFLLFQGKFRILFGFCPMCNSDAPAIYSCPVCHFQGSYEKRISKSDQKREWWRTFMYKIGFHSEDRDWITIYWKWDNLTYVVAPASYFDNRYNLKISFVPLVTIVLLPVILYFHLWFLLIGLIIPYGKVYWNFPIKSEIDDCEYPEYGFYLYGGGCLQKVKFDEIVICMGYKNKRIEMPWYLQWVRTSGLKKDGIWLHDYGRKDKRTTGTDFFQETWFNIIWHRTYTYIYTLKSGEKQYRAATIRVEEREWRPRWFKWTSIFAHVIRSINIEFAGKQTGEVGERTGSWKGGTTGCGWNMLPGETPEQTLRRMEKERKF